MAWRFRNEIGGVTMTEKAIEHADAEKDPAAVKAAETTAKEGMSKRLDTIFDKAQERLDKKSGLGVEEEPARGAARPPVKKETKEEAGVAAVKPADAAAPVVKAPEKSKPDEVAVTDDDKKDTPEGLTGKAAEAFWKMRASHRTEREKLVKENEELKKAGTQPVPAKKEEGVGVPERSLENDAKVFDFLAMADRVIDGEEEIEGWDAKKAGDVKKLAEQMLADMDNPQWCLEIIAKARRGEYGENSTWIAARAEKEYSLIHGRAEGTQVKAREAEARVQQLQAAIKTKLDESLAKFPELKDVESKQSKFGKKWMAENVVADDRKPLRRAAELYDPEKIGGLVDDMMAAYKAEQFSILEAEQKKLAGEGKGPLGAGGSPAPTGGGDGIAKKGSKEALSNIFKKHGYKED